MVRFFKRKIKMVIIAMIAAPIGFSLLPDGLSEIVGAEDIPTKAKQVIVHEMNRIPGAGLVQGVFRGGSKRSDYDRDDYGGWIDIDGDCQNTRHEVLLSSSIVSPRMSPNRCKVVSGMWLDPYSGTHFTEASELDIDHIVPLKWAHESGAAEWPDDKKRAFANDVMNLLAVSATLNRKKGASAPGEWLPPNVKYRCEYIINFYKISRRYDLLSPDEAIELRILRSEHCQ